jgi:hypothetical protein
MTFTSNVLGVVKGPEIPNRRAPKIQGEQGAILCSDRLYLLLQFFLLYRVSIKSFPDYKHYKKTTWNTNVFL